VLSAWLDVEIDLGRPGLAFGLCGGWARAALVGPIPAGDHDPDRSRPRVWRASP
jgi:hypothetical protein